MKKLLVHLKKALVFCFTLLSYSLIFVNDAPAQPPPPPPPPASAGGYIAQAVAIGAIVVYGVWRLRQKR